MQRLYCNGTIITMAAPSVAEAVLTEDGKILAVGKLEELLALSRSAERIDLEGCAMMPAFIDAHSHFSSYASSFLQVSLDESAGFNEIAERIRAFISSNRSKPGSWIFARGYDHNLLAEKQHPTLALLDECSPDNPLIVQHASGHVGVFNSPALKALGVSPSTVSPAGGRIGVLDGKLTGYMEENAYFTYMKKAPMTSVEEMLSGYQKAQNGYAAHGITTIQDGLAVKQMIAPYQLMLSKGVLKLDLVSYAGIADADELFAAFPQAVGHYDRHFRFGGYKMFLDGSPQGRTAWMRTPYMDETPPYYGYGTMKDSDVRAALSTAAEHHMQILAHCNGDAAAQQYIDAVKDISEKGDIAAIRPVMIHAQLLGRDQLPAVKRLGITPSFFVAHVYHWGDTHIRNFGMERASQISPAASALHEGIRFTFHQDTPVIGPDMLETVWCAVNRLTKNGTLLGMDERISVSEALKAVTVNAAWQYFEEDCKGSIEPGKEADFVLLDRDPLDTEPEKLRNIKVLRTIKSDEVIFEK